MVPIYDAGEHDGQLYLAMRLVEGGDLKATLAQGLEAGRLLRILDQIASALDAAHRRGLVHRDVKPANILLDEDDQAYLTDFGITKELSADSTGGGQLVGTLEYLAPEQIRGEPVDGRADEYSLACVLHEGLSGAPPFRRRTEAETLWGHMQEAPPPIGMPAVDDVLRRGLAKERDVRYATCAELVAAARGALGFGAQPAVPARPRRIRRIRRTAAIAGAVVAAAAVAVTAIALSRDKDEPAPSKASGIASFDGATGRFASLTEAPSPPSNVAVGEGAIWALNTEERTVTKIDPDTHEVVRRFSIGGIPSDIAAGAGAVWVGRGGGESVNATVAISRVDPRTTKVTHTTRLRVRRGDGEGWPSGGFPGIAVGWRRRVGRRPRRLDLAARPSHRARGRDGPGGGEHDRRRRRRRVVREREQRRGEPHRPADEPRRTDHPGRCQRVARHRRGCAAPSGPPVSTRVWCGASIRGRIR